MEIRNDGKRVGLDSSAEGFGMEEGGKGRMFDLQMIVQHSASENRNAGLGSARKPR
jgi:hypothetical protein